MPCFLIDTGCKCRKKLVSITTMRLRRSWGMGCRKTLFQSCDSRIISPMDIVGYRTVQREREHTTVVDAAARRAQLRQRRGGRQPAAVAPRDIAAAREQGGSNRLPPN